MSVRTLADSLVNIFGLTSRAIQKRIVTGRLTKAECEVIGSHLRMSMREYYDVFMNGLFVENNIGNFVCHVEEPFMHLHPTGNSKSMVRLINDSDRKKKKERLQTAQEILQELEKY